ncbi:hypothetical protein M080_6410 [Bacteroides fragilis str. 3397 T10]|nr:hypothetical protein M080_6410 [Bacteroides fragilis str. 3397 T10]
MCFQDNTFAAEKASPGRVAGRYRNYSGYNSGYEMVERKYSWR